MGKKEFEAWLERHPDQKAINEKWAKDSEGLRAVVLAEHDRKQKVLEKELEDNKEEVERYQKDCEERRKRHQESTGSEASTSS